MSHLTGLKCLVLNADYSPMSVIPLQSIPVEVAMSDIFSGKYHVVHEYDRKILTQNLDMNWPCVVACNKFQDRKEQIKLSRNSLYYRDHCVCSYCGKDLKLYQVTKDHVFPRKLGGTSSWENVVSSCYSCNQRKGHSLPKGDWTPRIKPYRPNYHQMSYIRSKYPVVVEHESWGDYLPNWTGEIRISSGKKYVLTNSES